MSSFHIPISINNENSTLPVHLDLPASARLSSKELTDFSPFNTWLSTLSHSLSLQSRPEHPFNKNPYTLSSVTVTSIKRFSASRIGFMTVDATVQTKQSVSQNNEPPKSETLPGTLLLRGPAVAMLIILQPDDVDPKTETDKHVLLTIQPRIPAGSLTMPELPAGMVDGGAFKGAAAREIEEECGLQIPENELVDLTSLTLDTGTLNPEGRKRADSADAGEQQEKLHRGVYTSAGGQDEAIAIFMHQRRVPRSQLGEWTGRLTGLRSEGEKITLKCIRLEDLWKDAARDSKALCAWALYDGLRREGKI